MARARSLKPGFFTNDELAECGPLGMLLFEGLWCHADRAGRLEDRPKRLKAEILPYFDADVDALLDELERRGFVVRYSANGSRFIQVVNFSKHQNPHKNEPPSTRPAPGEQPADTEPAPAADVAPPVTAPELHRASTVQAPDISDANRADSGLLTVVTGLRTPDCCDPGSGAEPEPAAPAHTEPTPIRSRKQPETPIPDGWQPSEATVAWAAERGFPPERIRREVERFTAHALAKDRRLARWDQGFRGWLTSDYCAPPTGRAPTGGRSTAGERQLGHIDDFLADYDRPPGDPGGEVIETTGYVR